MRKLLQQFCRNYFQEFENIRIAEPVSVSEGWESDVYAFDLEHGSPGNRVIREMILRVYPGNDAYEKSLKCLKDINRSRGLSEAEDVTLEVVFNQRYE